ncbi:MAG: transposase, partial [Rectinemataceae bacterium]|nr:transposase [Rectinemataceae bacterium]
GRSKLVTHLRRWHAGDASFKSRHPITLCADDFTRSARGKLGGWAGLFYSGESKMVVNGFNVEALCAVIGDGLEVLLLDIRIVPPDPEGGGRKSLNQNEWLRRSLKELRTFLQGKSTNLDGCSLSVDAAYVSPENIALTEEMNMALVSKLAANRIVTGDAGGPFTAKAGIFAGCAIFCREKKLRVLPGEKGVEYQRKTVYVHSLKREVLMVSFVREKDFLVYFSTNLTMKTITLRNILRYRWQLERIFWILKQDIGIGDIHHHKANRIETRIYLHFILAQVVRDVAGSFKCSPKDIIRNIRRSPEKLLIQLGFRSTFAANELPKAVPA